MSLTEESLREAIHVSSVALQNLAMDVSELTFPEPIELTIELHSLNDKYISDVLKIVPPGYAREFDETDFIYVFEVQNANTELKQKIYQRLCESREIQSADEFEGKKDICRPIHSDSEFLYVGRSQTLRSRLKQHLDAGNEGIYAMHMLRWCSGIEAKIKIYCYRFDAKPNLIVQALEDGLWDRFRPMFGRKGEK